MNKWHIRYIELAKEISRWSKDPSRQIGAIIVNSKNHIVGTGYNGFPVGILDSDERLLNKDFKRAVSLHAEEGAILNAKTDLNGCRIYIYGLCCCTHCAALIIQTGITEVYYRLSEKGESTHWKANIEIAEEILKEAGVSITKL